MTTFDDNPDGVDSDKPRKKSLNLDELLKPIANVDLSIGQIFLFSLRVSDMMEFTKLPEHSSCDRIRAFLPCIASLSSEYSVKKERIALSTDKVEQLSDYDVEKLAEAYISSGALKKTQGDVRNAIREIEEVASSYLDRLLRITVENYASQSRKLMDKMTGSTQGIFDQVRKSSMELGETWRKFEHLTKASGMPSSITSPSQARSFDFHTQIAEQNARLARERNEDREMIKLTGQMSAQSAKTLQELADAATAMLERLDQRDQEAKRTTKIQLWIAVGSVIISAFLALASFFQDRDNNLAGNVWQDNVLNQLKSSNSLEATLKNENGRLREEVQSLSAQMLVLQNNANTQNTKPQTIKPQNPDQKKPKLIKP
ncbi:MAG TPA: hypothetical protein PL131_13200 [Methylotenera sp.]|nr:hypothetical protein [Methylotenera sp.]